MGYYKVNSTNSLNFNLIFDDKEVGELVYEKWYSVKANIQMPDGKKFQLVPRGFWDTIIELKDNTAILLEFKMGWSGIIIKTFFNNTEERYLLKLKDKFILIDPEKKELLFTESDSKWSILPFEYNIVTTQEFDNLSNKELLILTILHCINYYRMIITSVV